MDSIKDIYQKAFSQIIQHNWKILVWVLAWVSVTCISFFFGVWKIFDSLLVPDSHSVGFLVFLLMPFVFFLFMPLSIAHLGIATAEDEDEPFWKLGMYGIFHPLRSILFNIVWYIAYALFYFALIFVLQLLAFLLVNSVVGIVILGLILCVISIIPGFWWTIAAFFLAYEEHGIFQAIGNGFHSIKSYLLSFIVTMLPCILVLGILGGAFGYACYQHASPVMVEYELAKQALSLSDQKETIVTPEGKLMHLDTFTEQKPVYDGNIKVYRRMLADYAAHYETHQAALFHRPVSEQVSQYLDAQGKSSSYIVICFILALPLILLVGYFLCLITQFFYSIAGASVQIRGAMPSNVSNSTSSFPASANPTSSARSDISFPLDAEGKNAPQNKGVSSATSAELLALSFSLKDATSGVSPSDKPKEHEDSSDNKQKPQSIDPGFALSSMLQDIDSHPENRDQNH